MKNYLFIVCLIILFGCEKEISLNSTNILQSAVNKDTVKFDLNEIIRNSSQFPWVRLSDSPLKRVGGFTFIINEKLYRGGGQTYNSDFSLTEFTDLKAFDFQTGIWTNLAAFPGGCLNGPVSFSIGSKGYVGLGYHSQRGSITDFWEYDSKTNKWNKISNFPGDPRNLATSFTIKGKAYVGAGNERGFINHKDFYCFDPKTNKWESISDYGGDPIYGATAFTIGDKAFVVGGVKDLDTRISECWEYDSKINIWTRKADFPGGPIGEGVVFSIKNKGYCGLGNLSNQEVSREFYGYNPEYNCWNKETSFPGETRFYSSFCSADKFGIVTGGYSVVKPFGDLWIFVPLK